MLYFRLRSTRDRICYMANRQIWNWSRSRIGRWFVARQGAQYCLVLLWLLGGAIFYWNVNQWTFGQAFYYSVQAGLSIGFGEGLLEEKHTISKLFTVVHVLTGAALIGVFLTRHEGQ